MFTKSDIIDVLRTIIDPELGVDLWTLGLIYNIDIEEGILDIRMTFTSIGCPFGPRLVSEVREKTEAIKGVKKSNIQVVFDPPWQPPDEIRGMMGLF